MGHRGIDRSKYKRGNDARLWGLVEVGDEQPAHMLTLLNLSEKQLRMERNSLKHQKNLTEKGVPEVTMKTGFKNFTQLVNTQERRQLLTPPRRKEPPQQGRLQSLLSRGRATTRFLKDAGQNAASQTAVWATAISVADVSNSLTKIFTESSDKILGTTATIYDKALDASYIESKIGGAYHRLFDEGHDVFSAWERVKGASPEDSLIQEVGGYISSLTKDAVTKMGIPVATVDKASFDKFADSISSIPGIGQAVDKAYIYDLLTTNAAELAASAVSTLGLVFAFKKDDYKKVSEILGALGVSTIMSANPILGLVTIAATCFTVRKNKLSTCDSFTGAGLALVTTALFAIIGLPILIEFVMIVAISKKLRTNLFDNHEVRQWLTDKVKSIKTADLRSVTTQLKASITRKRQPRTA